MKPFGQYTRALIVLGALVASGYLSYRVSPRWHYNDLPPRAPVDTHPITLPLNMREVQFYSTYLETSHSDPVFVLYPIWITTTPIYRYWSWSDPVYHIVP